MILVPMSCRVLSPLLESSWLTSMILMIQERILGIILVDDLGEIYGITRVYMDISLTCVVWTLCIFTTTIEKSRVCTYNSGVDLVYRYYTDLIAERWYVINLNLRWSTPYAMMNICNVTIPLASWISLNIKCCSKLYIWYGAGVGLVTRSFSGAPSHSISIRTIW